jgi:predicted MPP superfamily phosphohydrolase
MVTNLRIINIIINSVFLQSKFAPMLILTTLILTEILTVVVFRQHYKETSRAKYSISLIINSILSIYMWILFIQVSLYKGILDDPGHIWLLMNLTGTYCAVLGPRVLLDIFHFTGKLIKLKKGGHLRSLTNAGLIIWLVVFSIVIYGSTIGKFNFKTDEIVIKVPGLNRNLEGLTIVQLSDLHLAGFHRHKEELVKVMEKVNSFRPDIIINSGDFVSYGWREFDRCDTILSIARSRLGNFAVIGNHDIGTYNPELDEAGRDSNLVRVTELIKASGYKVLNEENTFINVGDARIAIIGVITKGRHPHMIHGDLNKAMAGTDSASFRILISHDPNHWEKAVRAKTNIDLTFSGHTHGMQMGILTRGFQWSPSQYFYPRWNGLYSDRNQFLYVNRGLGLLAIPFRIWMPPEISVIKLSGN